VHAGLKSGALVKSTKRAEISDKLVQSQVYQIQQRLGLATGCPNGGWSEKANAQMRRWLLKDPKKTSRSEPLAIEDEAPDPTTPRARAEECAEEVQHTSATTASSSSPSSSSSSSDGSSSDSSSDSDAAPGVPVEAEAQEVVPVKATTEEEVQKLKDLLASYEEELDEKKELEVELNKLKVEHASAKRRILDLTADCNRFQSTIDDWQYEVEKLKKIRTSIS
jgi:hypothetical protein